MLAAVILSGVLVVLGILDAWTTYLCLVNRSNREGNPILAKLQNIILGLPFGGPWLWLALAKSWMFLVLGMGWYVNLWVGDALWFMAGLVGFYFLVVVSNWKIYDNSR